MAYSKQKLDEVLEVIAEKLDISSELFNKAKSEYMAMGKWIDKKTSEDNTNFVVNIYPQGSMSLGTVIKPISDEGDYDVDLVLEMSESYGLSAEELKLEVVMPWLRDYKKATKLENKRRCWHVDYENMEQFHMDVIPSYDDNNRAGEQIKITDHDEELDIYNYIGSNPKGYLKWFFGRCEQRQKALMEAYSLLNEAADIEDLEKNDFKTPLQRSIQLLKRHRDVYFEKYSDEPNSEGRISSADKPISIIITTLAAALYDNGDSIVDTLNLFTKNAIDWLEQNKRDGVYHVDNPSLLGENFADKWETNPLRRKAFFVWMKQLQYDMDPRRLSNLDRISMMKELKRIFGENIGNQVINEFAKRDRTDIENGQLRVNAETGSLTKDGSIQIPLNHHHHG